MFCRQRQEADVGKRLPRAEVQLIDIRQDDMLVHRAECLPGDAAQGGRVREAIVNLRETPEQIPIRELEVGLGADVVQVELKSCGKFWPIGMLVRGGVGGVLRGDEQRRKRRKRGDFKLRTADPSIEELVRYLAHRFITSVGVLDSKKSGQYVFHPMRHGNKERIPEKMKKKIRK